eukprot:6204334-Pleurochrysis_carterae.AAC.3
MGATPGVGTGVQVARTTGNTADVGGRPRVHRCPGMVFIDQNQTDRHRPLAELGMDSGIGGHISSTRQQGNTAQCVGIPREVHCSVRRMIGPSG